MSRTVRGALLGFCVIATILAVVAAAQQMPTTRTERIPGQAGVKTEQLHGTVVFVEGNRLVVKMSTGEVKTFEVPEGRTAMIDGRQLKASELKPGTTLTATITTTTTPVTERTTTVGTGKVWFVSGNNVILTLPNNENRMYKVKNDYRFIVNGNKASVYDLRKGMTVSAEKIVEEPKVEIATNSVVTGHAPPPPKAHVAEMPPATPQPAAAATPETAAAAPAKPAEAAAEAPPAELPKTGSPLPLLGILGLASISAALLVRRLRHN